MIIKFPPYRSQHYWDIHYQFVLNFFEAMNTTRVKVVLDDKMRDFIEDNCFEINIGGKGFLLNYNDDGKEVIKDDLIPLKFHFKEGDIGYPFPSISFYDWEQYYYLQKILKYEAEGFISYKQRIYGNAIERRKKVLNILESARKKDSSFYLDTRWRSQITYWQEVSNIKVGIFVPGQNNNMLDRAQLQYMGFGVATISPYLPERQILQSLEVFDDLVDRKEYIKCKDDYSDLIDIIYSLKKEELKSIGEIVKLKFTLSFSPFSYQYILQHIVERS